jgi:O-antigen/teichoic acid export membrane protein
VLAALTMGDRILTLLFRPEYSGSGGVFARIMLAGGVGYVVSGQGYAMTAARSLFPQIPLALFTAASTALFAWWLVPLRGLAGAAEAWLLGSLIQLALSSVLMARLARAAVGRGGQFPAVAPLPADAV